MKRRIVTIIMTLCLLLSILPCECFAVVEAHQSQGRAHYKNPLYSDSIREPMETIDKAVSQIQLPKTLQAPQLAVGEPEELTFDCAVEVLREGAVNREESVPVEPYTICRFEVNEYPKDSETVKEYAFQALLALWEEALRHDEDPVHGDYIRWQYGDWTASYTYGWEELGNGHYQVSIENPTYIVSWYTTKKQEEAVDAIVEDFFEIEAVQEAQTDYEIARVIYKWLCDNVRYDDIDPDDYMLKYTAYAAAVDNYAVCQGYALLFYRLALECAVDARIVTGFAGNEGHAWNIVNLSGRYYCLDSTWDEGYEEEEWAYFLIGSYEFYQDHTTGDDILIENSPEGEEAIWQQKKEESAFIKDYDISAAGHVVDMEQQIWGYTIDGGDKWFCLNLFDANDKFVERTWAYGGEYHFANISNGNYSIDVYYDGEFTGNIPLNKTNAIERVDITWTGDIDMDGEVTVIDMAILFEYLSTGTVSETVQDAYEDWQIGVPNQADFNGDGQVNILDYQAIYQWLVKWMAA